MSNKSISNSKIEKLRNYSSIYSSTQFARLLKFDDFEFINKKISKYDIKLVDNKFTYSDYLKHTYKELWKNYCNEYIYKNTFVNEEILKKYRVKDTIAINEFKVGNSIADYVMFNGESRVFEIKTEFDSKKRLESQLNDYSKLFNYCYLIVPEHLYTKYLDTITDENVGIIQLCKTSRSLKLKEIRPPQRNHNINIDTLMRTIRTNEYKSIVNEHYETFPKMNDFNMFNICKEKIANIPVKKLNKILLDVIKKRKNNLSWIESVQKEIRHLVLAMNLNKNSYSQLELKLNKPIML